MVGTIARRYCSALLPSAPRPVGPRVAPAEWPSLRSEPRAASRVGAPSTGTQRRRHIKYDYQFYESLNSNTFAFEHALNWSGILIDGDEGQYLGEHGTKVNRPNTIKPYLTTLALSTFTFFLLIRKVRNSKYFKVSNWNWRRLTYLSSRWMEVLQRGKTRFVIIWLVMGISWTWRIVTNGGREKTRDLLNASDALMG